MLNTPRAADAQAGSLRCKTADEDVRAPGSISSKPAKD